MCICEKKLYVVTMDICIYPVEVTYSGCTNHSESENKLFWTRSAGVQRVPSLKSDVYWGSGWAGKRGPERTIWEAPWHPPKPNWVEACSNLWLSRQETCAWRWWSFMSAPVLADTAQVKKDHVVYNSVYFSFCRLKINQTIKFFFQMCVYSWTRRMREHK